MFKKTFFPNQFVTFEEGVSFKALTQLAHEQSDKIIVLPKILDLDGKLLPK